MADLAKRLYGPGRPTNVAADAYTTPATTTSIIKQLIIHNPTAGIVDYTFSVGVDGAGTRVVDALPVPADSTVVLDIWLVLAATEKVQHFASTTTVLNVTINGVETT